jgi:hypothetical protein
MPIRQIPWRFVKALGLVLMVATVGAAYAVGAFVQGNPPAQLPNGPAISKTAQ